MASAKTELPRQPHQQITATVKYSNHQKFLKHNQAPQPGSLPPQYRLLKQLILHQVPYTLHLISPRFIALHHPNLQNILVRAQQILTDDQFVDVTLALDSSIPSH